ncbi:hypothetical protein PXO_05490 [Xanthomonas oryzae pv. oryzae PXO99A]|uniref:Uncharacterized protein n=1 Tax=Xanthomonas oryzae pv. oryzae (strain PXO99A) TaxID=360094 RepID=A0A0K0GHD0_XANOP|nr:hypothetical protein PXO_05490 [Xanthomonas oryzae pv. oryzae PXO99A]
MERRYRPRVPRVRLLSMRRQSPARAGAGTRRSSAIACGCRCSRIS